jgi:4-hydroxy-3-methylbut-2-enyl diphosphate reductase
MAEKEAAGGGPVYTLGPLIHNPQALEHLEALGLGILPQGELPPPFPRGGTVIIRAHGVPPETEAEIRARGYRIVDATCPRVKANQLKARALGREGYGIFLAGEESHGELVGIRGYAREASSRWCETVASGSEAESAAEEILRVHGPEKAALIGQTTISPGEYERIARGIRKHFPHLEIIDTICGATRERQESLGELLGLAEAVIIAGGRNSANTRRLLTIARERGKPSWLVETPGEIPAEVSSYKVVGIAAGASTPDRVIDEIERALKSLPRDPLTGS